MKKAMLILATITLANTSLYSMEKSYSLGDPSSDGDETKDIFSDSDGEGEPIPTVVCDRTPPVKESSIPPHDLVDSDTKKEIAMLLNEEELATIKDKLTKDKGGLSESNVCSLIGAKRFASDETKNLRGSFEEYKYAQKKVKSDAKSVVIKLVSLQKTREIPLPPGKEDLPAKIKTCVAFKLDKTSNLI